MLKIICPASPTPRSSVHASINWCDHKRSRPSVTPPLWRDPTVESLEGSAHFKAPLLTVHSTLGLKSLRSFELTSPWPSGEDNTHSSICCLNWIACFSISILSEPIQQSKLPWVAPLDEFSSLPMAYFLSWVITRWGKTGRGNYWRIKCCPVTIRKINTQNSSTGGVITKGQCEWKGAHPPPKIQVHRENTTRERSPTTEPAPLAASP